MFYYVNAIIRRGKKRAFWTGEVQESSEGQGQQSVEDEFQADLENQGYKVYVICTPRAFRTKELVEEWYRATGRINGQDLRAIVLEGWAGIKGIC